jgi:hypothetical protein
LGHAKKLKSGQQRNAGRRRKGWPQEGAKGAKGKEKSFSFSVFQLFSFSAQEVGARENLEIVDYH